MTAGSRRSFPWLFMSQNFRMFYAKVSGNKSDREGGEESLSAQVLVFTWAHGEIGLREEQTYS